jgi:hypothetical protein
MLIPNGGTRQGERRGEEGRDTGLRRGTTHQFDCINIVTFLVILTSPSTWKKMCAKMEREQYQINRIIKY